MLLDFEGTAIVKSGHMGLHADIDFDCPKPARRDGLLLACAVIRRRFPVGERPTRPQLQPEATGAGMEVTKCLKPSDRRVTKYGDSASVQAAT